MDENKRLKLHEIGYTIQRCCRNCARSVIDNPPWGTCLKNQYVHLKHTGDPRNLSINMDGVCEGHEWSDYQVTSLNLFKEFLEKRIPIKWVATKDALPPKLPMGQYKRYLIANEGIVRQASWLGGSFCLHHDGCSDIIPDYWCDIPEAPKEA